MLLYSIFDQPLLSDITETLVPLLSFPTILLLVEGPLLTFNEFVFTVLVVVFVYDGFISSKYML